MKRLVMAALIVAVVGLPARAELIVDQEFTPPSPLPSSGSYFGINLDNSIFPTSHIGQSFTPTFAAVDTISFYLQDDNRSNGTGGSFFVELVTVDFSMVLAISEAVTVADGFGDGITFDDPTNLTGSEVLFPFASSAPLVPGQTYVAQLRKIGGDRFRVRGEQTNGYANGRYVGSNTLNDLYFREGIRAVPEPPGTALLAIGLALSALRIVERG